MLRAMDLHESLSRFADTVRTKLAPPVQGEAEDQLRAPFERLMSDFGGLAGRAVVATGETSLGPGLGKPDFALTVDGVLAGYAELKAPGKGADAHRFRGHDKKQFDKFAAIPNLLYTDGSSWVLYRNGQPYDRAALSGDIERQGALAAGAKDAAALHRVLSAFLLWQPEMPADFKQLAAALAPLCKLLKDDIAESLARERSELAALAGEWRKWLFPEASDDRFADAYAQTVTFALLLARLDGGDVLDLDHAYSTLRAQHTLLARALQLLTEEAALREIAPAVRLLQRTIAALRPQLSTGHDDPWLYFYEDFLAAYDEQLRKDYGVYYTPIEVVRCQVRLVDELLRTRLKRPLGFASDDVVTLDPAAGTGTYLLAIVEHALSGIAKQQGRGAVAAHASRLAGNLYGFELMVGPYSVAELRVSRALADREAALPPQGLGVYLTDTLESPNAQLVDLPQFLRPLSDQHKRALQLKKSQPVLVCLGNPPYDRHAAAREGDRGASGNWVRHGDHKQGSAILDDFIAPATASGLGVHVKNLYNLYVYFWRWALWKVFEHDNLDGPGIVSFISASSYLTGPGFAGMREHLRRVCDEIWILDLGGEGRGADASDNVFNIQTPVAIAIAFRRGKPDRKKPAAVHYLRLDGSRSDKLAALDRIRSFAKAAWEACPSGWQDRFTPEAKGEFAKWPLLTDLFPWQHSGVQWKRTWPIAPTAAALQARWTRLLDCRSRGEAFRETLDRRVAGTYPSLLSPSQAVPSLASLPAGAPMPRTVRYAYRSLDRQFAILDARLADRIRPPLWRSFGPRQCYITSLLTAPLGRGPALMAAACVPDLDHFRGSFGAKHVAPLYCDAAAARANVNAAAMECLRSELGKRVSPEDFFAYVYGVLAHPGYTRRYAEDQKRAGVRVPLTREARLFNKAVKIGRRLLWLHTYGERFAPKGATPGVVPGGKARCLVGVPGTPEAYPDRFDYDAESETLRVGGGEFAPVAQAMWDFDVSGLRVLRSWLGYRMRERKGKKTSPLDDIHPERWTAELTDELLSLLWILEATIEGYPEQERLFDEIVAGPLLPAAAIPIPPGDHPSRKPPADDGPTGQLDFG